MYQHVKGKDVNLFLKHGEDYAAVAASTSCDINITANTEEAASKSDFGDGLFNNPEFLNYTWNLSNESFVVDMEFMAYFMDKILNGDATFDTSFQTSVGGDYVCLAGKAIVTYCEITANNGEYAKIRLSLIGSGAIGNGTMQTTTTMTTDKIKGKALMIAMHGGAGNDYRTIACSTGHTLSIDIQTEDISDKDTNDKVLLKEVVGKSVKLTTNNLIGNYGSSSTTPGMTFTDIFSRIFTGTEVTLEFGYYHGSIGASIHDDPSKAQKGWGRSNQVLVSGTFLVTSFSQNGTVKENSTWTAEFTSKGKVNVPLASAAAEE